MKERERPVVLTRGALDPLSGERERAIWWMFDDPFWLVFFFWNRGIIAAILESDQDLSDAFFLRVQTLAERAKGKRAKRVAADILAHPHLTDGQKSRLLDAMNRLADTPKSIRAMSGGLPGLGKRR